jgi:hypothetical protein
MVNSTKQALNSAGGIVLRPGGVIKAGAAVAMRGPFAQHKMRVLQQ